MNTSTPSSWFEQEDVLLAEVRRTTAPRGGGTPSIEGYTALAEIGRGGQGVVYSGIQASTNRRVAIKVLLDGALASGAARRRFEREIELVASLRHPGIVAIHDSGVTNDGRLYCVMELVAGHTLGDPPSTPPMAPARAAELIAQVADAVHHAHQRGVIHRDLKPSNIRLDADGRVRVLDFGLAKLSSEPGGLARSMQVSLSGQFMGSLPWASPEHASGGSTDAAAVDVRSDVYSMGVVLYQLLSGRLPYDVSSGLKAALENIASAEPTSLRSLVPGIAEDLATIVRTALAKDPARRYQSASALAGDLRQFLAGEPIAARRDSAWYTVRKTLRRYRIAAAAAAVVLVATLVGLGVSLAALQEARAQRDLATRQWQSARAVSKFVEDMLGAADPGKEGKDIKVIDVLGPASALADQTLKDQPAARAMVHGVLSTAYRNLQLFDDAKREAENGLAIATSELAGKGRETSRLRVALAAVLIDLGQADKGLEEATAALDLARAEEGPDSLSAIEAATAVAYALEELRRLDESEAMKRDILERATRTLGPDAQDTLGAAGNLGRTLFQLGKLDDAIAILEPTIERSRIALGPDNIATLAPISTLVSAYKDKGYREKAEPLLKDAWERLRRTYGQDSASALVYANNYAILLHESGRSKEAKPIAEEVLAGLIKIYGPEHMRVLGAMSTLGSMEGAVGDNAKQLEYQSKALAIADKQLGRTHPTTVYVRNNYASTLGKLKRFEEAITEYRACVVDADAAFPPGDSMPPCVRFNLAKHLKEVGKNDEAIEILRPASDKLLETLGPKSDWTTDSFETLIQLLEAKGLKAEADQWRAKLGAAK